MARGRIGRLRLDPTVAEVYELGEEIGRGAFSIVHRVVNKETGEQFAMKIINKEKVGMEAKVEERMKREVDILKSVRHPNIIPLHDLFETENRLYLVMELVSGGELFNSIVERQFYSEEDARAVIRNITSALDYLHERKIAHRDLKPENLLLKNKNETRVMISDFGLSRILGEDTNTMHTACGTPYYVAPEILDPQRRGYGLEVDLWSLGVITYFLLAGYLPFMGETLPEVVQLITAGQYDFPSPYWDNISEEAINFVSLLLTKNVSKRMTAKDALDHPWLNKEVLPSSVLSGFKQMEITNTKRKETLPSAK
eukprot:TRINITY_DN19_c0_g1_i1.p1 TRINITY_DN19_c0_g1~~TRINITY_DN19_c0_g1_i1.p1  ORF type:complete len:312 (+),score=26.38 TRINITY_DN19_c0_g1_i1:10-945(+)